MTPGDVMAEITSDDRIRHWGDYLAGRGSDQCGEAMLMWGHIQHLLRPEGPWHTPLSPKEVEHLRVSLRTILDTIEVAHSRTPQHFYVVQEGGR